MTSRRTFLAVLFIALVFVAYWSAWAANAYSTFHDYDDLGIFAHNMYLDIFQPSQAGTPLQHLVFGNHIAPDQLLILPFYAFLPSPLTLLFIQVIVLALTAIAVFCIAKGLLQSERLGFLFFLAFILNAGVWGMLVFDYHTEAFIILFYVLAFFFYMGRRRWFFLLSLLLLLGTMEDAPFLGLTLGLGLLLYELLYAPKTPQRSAGIRLAMVAIALSLAVFVAYHFLALYLTQNYGMPAFASMPSYLHVLPPSKTGAAARVGVFAFVYGTPYLTYWLLAGVLLFGIALFFDPLVSLVLASPFLVEAFVLKDVAFILIWYQYYSFLLGGIFVAAVLGLLNLRENRGLLARCANRLYGRGIWVVIGYSMLLFTALVLIFYPNTVISPNIPGIRQVFLFRNSIGQSQAYAQVYSMLALIPSNASLAAPFFVVPHVVNRPELADGGVMAQPGFQPEYILIDNSTIINPHANASVYVNYARDANYTLIARNGSALLLEKAP